MKYSALLLFILINYSLFATQLCLKILNSVQKETTEFIPIEVDLPSALSSLKEQINPDNTYFIILPGNMGKLWKKTNHNVGFDLMKKLTHYFSAIATTKKSMGSEEVFQFSTKDYGEDFHMLDTQTFYSERKTYRTKDGEIFVSQNERQPTLIFLRRVGFYNDGGNFFVPVIQKLKGKVENTIVIHDDLNGRVGEIEVNLQTVYNGNRAILSIHNNLNAFRIDNLILEKQTEIVEIITQSKLLDYQNFGFSPLNFVNTIRSISWKLIIEVKNQTDKVGFKNKFIQSLRPKVLAFLEPILAQIRSQLTSELEQIANLKKNISTAADKRQAAKEYQDILNKLKSENNLLNLYFELENKVNDVTTKKSSLLNSIYSTIVADFDPRQMQTQFKSLAIGTGYEQWVENGKKNGYPELPIGLETSDFSGFPHFVLSKRDPYFDKVEFEQQVIAILKQLVSYNSN